MPRVTELRSAEPGDSIREPADAEGSLRVGITRPQGRPEATKPQACAPETHGHGAVAAGSWLGWKAPSGAGGAERRRPSAAWEEVGQGREEGEALPGRGGRSRGGSWPESGHVLEHVEGKNPQELSSPGDAERKRGQAARIPLRIINLRVPRRCRQSQEAGY